MLVPAVTSAVYMLVVAGQRWCTRGGVLGHMLHGSTPVHGASARLWSMAPVPRLLAHVINSFRLNHARLVNPGSREPEIRDI